MYLRQHNRIQYAPINIYTKLYKCFGKPFVPVVYKFFIAIDKIKKSLSSLKLLWTLYICLLKFLYGGFITGLLTFLYTISNGHADVAWTAFHLNFVFWAGVSHGGVLFACAMRITSSSWGRSLMRICESFAAFMPVVFILLLVLLFAGGEQTLPYLAEEYKDYDAVTSKKWTTWLNFNFVLTRSVLLIGTLHILTYYYLYHSIKQDCEGTERFKGFFSFLSSTPTEGEEVDHDQKLYKYSIAIAFAYSLSMTFLAFDFMMSLHPHFYSTLFGVYYFMASVLAALGLVVIISSMMTIKFKLESVITQFQYYDAAKLMFGLSVLAVYILFSVSSYMVCKHA